MGLFKPAWKSKNLEKAKRALRKILDNNKTKQEELAEIVSTLTNVKLQSFCYEALYKINDYSILTRLSKNKMTYGELYYGYIKKKRTELVKEITSEPLLIEIIKNDPEGIIRLTALENEHMTDRSGYDFVLSTDRDSLVREYAIKKTTNQDLIERIALTDSSNTVKVAAIKNLNNHALLIDFVKCTDNAQIFSAAIYRLHELHEMSREEMDDIISSAIMKATDNKRFIRDLNNHLFHLYGEEGDKIEVTLRHYGFSVKCVKGKARDEDGEFDVTYELVYYKNKPIIQD
jgi:hypothetical protein